MSKILPELAHCLKPLVEAEMAPYRDNWTIVGEAEREHLEEYAYHQVLKQLAKECVDKLTW